MALQPSSNGAALNPRTTHYEFFGPPGALAVSLGVPFLTYALYFGCNEASGGCPPPVSDILDRLGKALSSPEWWASLWDTRAALTYLAWYAYCVAAWAILPGDWIDGVVMRNGQRKKYKINAFSTFLLTLGLTFGYIYRNGPESFTFIYENWVGFVTASIAMSVTQAAYCYASSFYGNKLLALGGNSGNPIYDVCPRLPLFVSPYSLTFDLVLHRPRAQPVHRLL